MKTVILSCPTLRGELQIALQQAHNDAAVYFLPQELHSNPDKLRSYLQNIIDNLYNVDKVVICVSGCGGGTAGLKATTAELVIPKTRDCIDILLSEDDLSKDNRKRRVYMTKSWYDVHQKSSLNLDKLIAAKGKEEAENFIRMLYKGFEEFYIIDTGTYDVQEVVQGLQPFIDVLGGSFKIIQGKYSVLHKIAREQFDDSFLIIPKGETVPAKFYPENPQ